MLLCLTTRLPSPLSSASMHARTQNSSQQTITVSNCFELQLGSASDQPINQSINQSINQRNRSKKQIKETNQRIQNQRNKSKKTKSKSIDRSPIAFFKQNRALETPDRNTSCLRHLHESGYSWPLLHGSGYSLFLCSFPLLIWRLDSKGD